MTRVLITAFEPYDGWTENSSWLTLVELTRELPAAPQITTRRYPVDFDALRDRLAHDLGDNYDFVLSLGQAAGSGKIHLEKFALNHAGRLGEQPESFEPLVLDGPVAYLSGFPVSELARAMQLAEIPARVSHDAGSYVCNATLYLTHYLSQQMGLTTKSMFMHIPLAVRQVLEKPNDLASLPTQTAVAAVQLILDWIVERAQVSSRSQ